jgi:hypothetical protein
MTGKPALAATGADQYPQTRLWPLNYQRISSRWLERVWAIARTKSDSERTVGQR